MLLVLKMTRTPKEEPLDIFSSLLSRLRVGQWRRNGRYAEEALEGSRKVLRGTGDELHRVVMWVHPGICFGLLVILFSKMLSSVSSFVSFIPHWFLLYLSSGLLFIFNQHYDRLSAFEP